MDEWKAFRLVFGERRAWVCDLSLIRFEDAAIVYSQAPLRSIAS